MSGSRRQGDLQASGMESFDIQAFAQEQSFLAAGRHTIP
jgi:hypothetical protein